MKLTIDGTEYEVEKINNYGTLPSIEVDGMEFYLAEDSTAAGLKARERWADMVENDKKEFVCMVGEETLVSWAMGEYAGPGSTQVKSLDEWLDLWLDTPEEEFAGYVGEECDVENADDELIDELGFIPTVAYRSN